MKDLNSCANLNMRQSVVLQFLAENINQTISIESVLKQFGLNINGA